MNSIWKLILSIAVCQLVAAAGSVVTIPAISTWYTTLHKPNFNPPDWVFGPVWTILFLLMGISAYLVWNKGLKQEGVKMALLAFLIQLGLNFLWSFIFFGLHSPLLAFFEIIILWLAILMTILQFAKTSKLASYLLIPYILWVTYASLLNFFIVLLNPVK